jgi:ketosteroid isomerase-like protein
MAGEQQKARAKELLEAADRGDAAAVEAMISNDFTLEEMLRVPIMLPTGEPLPTVYEKEAYLDFVRSIPSFTKDGMHFTYELAMSDGPYVVIFGESNATALSCKKYANAYSWLFRFTEDKIALLREYCDTNLVRTVLFG